MGSLVQILKKSDIEIFRSTFWTCLPNLKSVPLQGNKMRLFHFFLVLLFVAIVYGDNNDDDYDDVTEDSAVEEMSADDGESSGNVTDYDYPEDLGSLPVKQEDAGCTGKFRYGKNKTKIKHLTRNA